MKQGFTALQSGDWEEYTTISRVEVKATEWASDRRKRKLSSRWHRMRQES